VNESKFDGRKSIQTGGVILEEGFLPIFLRKMCRFDDIDSIGAIRFNIMHLLV